MTKTITHALFYKIKKLIAFTLRQLTRFNMGFTLRFTDSVFAQSKKSSCLLTQYVKLSVKRISLNAISMKYLVSFLQFWHQFSSLETRNHFQPRLLFSPLPLSQTEKKITFAQCVLRSVFRTVFSHTCKKFNDILKQCVNGCRKRIEWTALKKTT